MHNSIFSALIAAVFLSANASVSADYDDGMRYGFVASKETNTVTIIDVHAQAIVNTITLEESPGTIAASDRVDSLVIAFPNTSRLGLVDLDTSRPTPEFYDLEIRPDKIKLDPITDSIAIYDIDRKVLEVHNIQKRIRVLRLGGVNTDLELTFDRRGDHIYWVDRGERRLNTSDMQGNTRSIQLGRSGEGFSAMTRSVDGSTGFISDSAANKVYVINIGTMQQISEVKTGQNPGKACGTADGLLVLVPNKGSHSITAFSSFTFETSYTVNTIDNPIAVYPAWLDATAAVIGSSGEVAMIDLESGVSRKSFNLLGTPHRGVVTHNSRSFLLPISGYSSIVMFDMETQAIVERIVDLPSDIGDITLAVYSDQCN
jgi:hypothetical protein